MISHQTLGKLSNLHELLTQLVKDLPAAEVNQPFLSGLPSMGWLLGRSVYLETYWLREKLLKDDNLTARVRHIFAAGYKAEIDQQVPPKDHLLNWALEIQDANLTLLANPNALPEHPWLTGGWLGDYLLQVHSQIYEQMISVVAARAIALNSEPYQVKEILCAAIADEVQAIEVSQGHYRIGAKEGVVFDNEQPVQVAELHNYRICSKPISNSQYLYFLEHDGYQQDKYWSTEGLDWRNSHHAQAPWNWRQDNAGNWFAIGLNGAMDLLADSPVTAICWYEAQAFTQWASTELSAYKGAILPHEYQWEVAARTQGMTDFGRVWEWCNNTFDAYDLYEQPADSEMRTQDFATGNYSRRGGCLHSQAVLRRPSYRQSGTPSAQHLFTGLRLVLPPAHVEEALYIEQWQKLLN